MTIKTSDLMCPFCLLDRASLRIDRKGRPYLTCTCGSRCFVPSLRDAIRYLAISESVFRAHAQAIAADPVQAAKFAQYEASVARAFKEIFARPQGEQDSNPVTTGKDQEKVA